MTTNSRKNNKYYTCTSKTLTPTHVVEKIWNAVIDGSFQQSPSDNYTYKPRKQSVMASYNSIVKAASIVVMEAKRSVIDDLMAYLNEKVELEDEFTSMVEEFKAKLIVDQVVDGDNGKKRKGRKSSGDKVKRAPSAYNLFIKDAMAKLREQSPDMTAKARLTEATQMWKKHKAASVEEAVVEVEMEPESPSSSNETTTDNEHKDDDSDDDDGLKEFLQKAVVAKAKTSKPRSKKSLGK